MSDKHSFKLPNVKKPPRGRSSARPMAIPQPRPIIVIFITNENSLSLSCTSYGSTLMVSPTINKYN